MGWGLQVECIPFHTSIGALHGLDSNWCGPNAVEDDAVVESVFIAIGLVDYWA